jgi:precorrin-3B C17-methyltransferase
LPWENEQLRGERSPKNKFSIVGIGPGARELRTFRAEEAIRSSDFVVGYRPYLDLIEDLLPGKEVFSSSMGKEVDRVKAAVDLLEKGSVALVSSGDPNVYGMAGLGLELAPVPDVVEIVPGVTSFTAAACRAALAFRESVAVISLSDLLTPWQEIEGRLRIAAQQGMPVALYNPRSKRRDWQLIRALEILGERDLLVAKDVSRENEEIFWTSSGMLLNDEVLRERIDMTTLLILCGKGVFRGEPQPGVNPPQRIPQRIGLVRDTCVNLVGIGPGDRKLVTLEAERILRESGKIFGAERYLNEIGDLSPEEKITHIGPCSERMAARFREAIAMVEGGGRAAILTGGDPSVFSSAWRIFELARGVCSVHCAPGVSAFSSVAARAGAPLVNDFALFSEPNDSVALLAESGFGVVIYNVKGVEISNLLREVDPGRSCVLARDVTRDGEEVMVMEAADLLEAKPSGFRFTLLIASAHSHIKEGKIITRRGYESKYRY